MGSATSSSGFPDFLDLAADQVAEGLLGCEIERKLDGETVVVRIVETEAYDEMDEASHTFRGRTPRNEVMFSEPGHLYVYFTYGMHYCCNVVCGPAGHGAAALIRAVEPVEGVESIERRRGIPGKAATNGPAKLCEGLGIDLEMNGHDLRREPLVLRERQLSDGEIVARTTRIGITRAADRVRRYLIAGNPYVSRPA
ncbi:MAG: DNA-3-methyladenine glycosylase [Solirubrobacterales bacterium]|nr:DNA-3-methyladenine glycosylase [Solirubrobacterales bacterium]